MFYDYDYDYRVGMNERMQRQENKTPENASSIDVKLGLGVIKGH